MTANMESGMSSGMNGPMQMNGSQMNGPQMNAPQMNGPQINSLPNGVPNGPMNQMNNGPISAQMVSQMNGGEASASGE
jgi:hypothetical protein